MKTVISKLTCLWLALFLSQTCRATLLETNLPSRFIGPRHIHIYLPPSYATNLSARYPVLYLHDGQNVFSSAGTNAAFGWGSWELDKTADALCASNRICEIIMVAVDNSPARMQEYSGRHHETNAALTPYKNYSSFLITELKPFVDHEFRTLPDPAHTVVMGSSMGGLCSVALAWDHPEVFGGAASLSGAFQVERTNFLEQVLKPYHGKRRLFICYLDSGVVDFMGGDDNATLTKQVADELARINDERSVDYYLDAHPLTPKELAAAGLRRDKWAEAQTSQHNEFYWRLRSGEVLAIFFPPPMRKR